LQKERLILGGETSGHIINLDLTTTGDGIISALQVLEAMLSAGKSLSELKQAMPKYPQRIKNVTLTKKIDLIEHEGINVALRDVESTLGGSGRVVLRHSGTEPLIRILVEGENEEQLEKLVAQLADKVREVTEGSHC